MRSFASFLGTKQIKSDYDGILVFGITLGQRQNNLLPTRSQLAEISRAFNREFYYTPVVLVFKYHDEKANYIGHSIGIILDLADSLKAYLALPQPAGKVFHVWQCPIPNSIQIDCFTLNTTVEIWKGYSLHKNED